MIWGELQAGDVVMDGSLDDLRHAWLITHVQEAGDVYSNHIIIDVLDVESGLFDSHNRRRDGDLVRGYHVLRGQEVLA